MITDTILNYLQSKGIGTATIDLFNGFLPAQPVKAAGIFLYGGSPVDTKRGYTEPRLNIRIRNSSEDTAYAFASLIYNALHGLHNVILEDIPIVSCKALQSEPTTVGRDEQERSMFTLNFALRIRKQTEHSD
jgi:hypothetical protein